ncbi:MAG: hypothetical protein K6E50_02100 [Lachnospiraceae bacterium]|nr:hypothetical protein [Lachnospiraceae bacterium]
MEELRLTISGIVEKDGKKKACVSFSGEGCYAEGYIPDCELVKSSGFTKEEEEALRAYLKENLAELKKQAARINPLFAIMKE